MTATPPLLSSPPARRGRRLLAAALAAAVLTACGAGADDRPGAQREDRDTDYEVVLVASSAARAGLEAVIPLFEDSKAGEDTTVLTGYGPSAGQSRKIVDGLEADAVALSVATDITRLVDEDIVDPSWADDATGGVAFTSPVVLVTRADADPVADWAELLVGDAEVITPDPRSSGAAMWNLLAPYAALSGGGADPQAGIAGVTELIDEHVRTRPSSARAATEQFLAGTGDVLIATEQEARAAIEGGAAIDYTVPATTVVVEFPVAVTRIARAPRQARALVDFLFTPAAQQALAEAGYRPVDPGLPESAGPDGVRAYRIAELGGWEQIHRELFDPDRGAIVAAYDGARR